MTGEAGLGNLALQGFLTLAGELVVLKVRLRLHPAALPSSPRLPPGPHGWTRTLAPRAVLQAAGCWKARKGKESCVLGIFPNHRLTALPLSNFVGMKSRGHTQLEGDWDSGLYSRRPDAQLEVEALGPSEGIRVGEQQSLHSAFRREVFLARLRLL